MRRRAKRGQAKRGVEQSETRPSQATQSEVGVDDQTEPKRRPNNPIKVPVPDRFIGSAVDTQCNESTGSRVEGRRCQPIR